VKVFVAGASGVVGRHLIPQLVDAGHEVVAMTRSPDKTAHLRELGAQPVVADAVDQPSVTAAVRQARPQAVVHQLTAIPVRTGVGTFDRTFAATNRLRTRGTDILLAAARSAGASRFVAQSFCGWTYIRTGGPVKTEDDPLDPTPVRRSTKASTRSATSNVPSSTHAGWTAWCCVMGSSTARAPRSPPTVRSANWLPSGASRSSAKAPACGRSCT
jgi:nucleoside-diphosphate-sugar epimerase